jgi:RNA polymerase sigma-70 factor, ECF subfamily
LTRTIPNLVGRHERPDLAAIEIVVIAAAVTVVDAAALTVAAIAGDGVASKPVALALSAPRVVTRIVLLLPQRPPLHPRRAPRKATTSCQKLASALDADQKNPPMKIIGGFLFLMPNFLLRIPDKGSIVEGIRSEISQRLFGHRGPSEQSLLARAQQGDRTAFDGLVGIHQTALRGFLRRRLPIDMVEDVIQETFLAAWSALPGFELRPTARLKTWLYRIALHKTADSLRRAPNDLPLETLALAHSGASAASTDTALWVHALLQQLPEEQRVLLELYYFEDLTLAEVALVLDRNINTVKYHFYQAHARSLALAHQEGIDS